MANKSYLLKAAFGDISNKQLFTWLNGRSYSEAFVICIGAGPWKFNRRKAIQQNALIYLNNRKIENLVKINWYPLFWQNDFVNTLANKLNMSSNTMDRYCNDLRILAKTEPKVALKLFYENVCGHTKGSKVLSLFCRDSLRIPSFPIDRHVRRKLQLLNLPVNEFELIELCNDVGLDPRVVATAFVRDAGDVDNPDWSL